jgi:hypothetical protein
MLWSLQELGLPMLWSLQELGLPMLWSLQELAKVSAPGIEMVPELGDKPRDHLLRKTSLS